MIDLAIVIPYFKIAHFEETLKSLKSQTNQNFNVYIGDDASLESPKLLIAQLQLGHRVNYHRFDQNLGGKSLTKQWQRCLDLVQGEENWVMILCDDDVLSNNCVQEFYVALETITFKGINVVRFSSRVINEKNEFISKQYNHPEVENPIKFLFRKEQGGTRSSLSEYVFKRINLKNYHFLDLPLAWHSDTLAVIENSINSSIYTINSASVFFRLFEGSITGSSFGKNLKNKATISYYYYLLKSYNSILNDLQKSHLKKRIFKYFFENKKSIHFWRLMILTALK